MLYAKDIRVRSIDKLSKKLAQAPYSLVLFYDKSRELMRNDEMKQKIGDMEAMFLSLSKDDYYKDANLQFIRAQVNKQDLQSAQQKYQLTELPAFAIFLGRQLKATLYGYVFRDAVEQFIEQNLKSKMEEIIKQADELRKKRLEEAKIRAYNRPYYYGPYWYGGYYPYWWYGYGRPYSGIYFW
jgi:cysteinyl-tRNA synthetase